MQRVCLWSKSVLNLAFRHPSGKQYLEIQSQTAWNFVIWQNSSELRARLRLNNNNKKSMKQKLGEKFLRETCHKGIFLIDIETAVELCSRKYAVISLDRQPSLEEDPWGLNPWKWNRGSDYHIRHYANHGSRTWDAKNMSLIISRAVFVIGSLVVELPFDSTVVEWMVNPIN